MISQSSAVNGSLALQHTSTVSVFSSSHIEGTIAHRKSNDDLRQVVRKFIVLLIFSGGKAIFPFAFTLGLIYIKAKVDVHRESNLRFILSTEKEFLKIAVALMK